MVDSAQLPAISSPADCQEELHWHWHRLLLLLLLLLLFASGRS